MASVDKNFARHVKELENVVFVCFGAQFEEGLSQIASDDDVVIDMIGDSTLKPTTLVDATIHHQIDPSYEGETL